MKHYLTTRQYRHALWSALFMLVSLGIGLAGYMYFGNLKPIDALLNASMILTGMGPVDKLEGDAAKMFASFYSLYSGVAFLTAVGVLFAPAIHRFTKKLDEEHLGTKP